MKVSDSSSRIIRITALIPTFALIYFINIYLGLSAVYLIPWGTAFESIALASFFFLVCDYLSGSLSTQTPYISDTLYLSPKGASAPLSIEELTKIKVNVTLIQSIPSAKHMIREPAPLFVNISVFPYSLPL